MNFKSKNILLAGIDLDGTLLKDDKTISDASLSAIKNARERGIVIVPITGRPLSGVPDFIKKLDEIDYIVTSNGAYITDLKSEKNIYSQKIDHNLSLKYIKLANEYGLYCEAFSNGFGYVDERTMNRHLKIFKDTPLYDYIIMSRMVVDDVYDYINNNGDGADEIFCIAQNPEQRDLFKKQIAKDNAIKFCELDDIYIELTDASVDKGETLKRLCEYLGISPENTIAFGDGENDLSFMKAAGIGVAMGNAKGIIKENADITVDTNENDGVAKILELL